MYTPEIESQYVSILKEELLLATGCTEPIAIASAAAVLRQTLGEVPERITVGVSGNILKNVKSVIVPNTGGLKGVRAAVAAGIIAGNPSGGLQVLSAVDKKHYPLISDYLQRTPMEIACIYTQRPLDILLTGHSGDHKAIVRIANSHNNLVYAEKDGKVLYERECGGSPEEGLTDKSSLNMRDIYTFACCVDLSLVQDVLDRQIQYNMAIAKEGLENSWGANIGTVLIKSKTVDICDEVKAWAAAGSDARMSGCELPVVIVAGSGNQGITASVPVIQYAHYLGVDSEKRYRALLISDLITVYQKAGIGRLSAYCGAVSAGAGAGAGIAYLEDGSFDAVVNTVSNAVAILSGMVCDGAKPSCAAKIAASVEAGMVGFRMYQNGSNFLAGDGIVGYSADDTVANISTLAQKGMRETDSIILNIMTRQ